MTALGAEQTPGPVGALSTDDVMAEFRAAGALLEGHFVLSSGRHSPVFLQKTRIFMDPTRTARLCAALAARVRDTVAGPVEAVVAPAVGAIIPGYETARQLGCASVFVERDGGVFRLRRGQTLSAGAPVIVVEDIVTTGGSAREAVVCAQELGADVRAAACLVDRSGGSADVGAPLIALAQVNFPTYAPEDVPADLAAIAPQDPGSRRLS